MGLSSALFSGTSGLYAHGEKMTTIGDNLSNVSTVGFKKSVMHFEDFMPQDINTSAGIDQVGRGVAVGTVMKDFQQGSLETTNESTDVAIGGEGFFTVSAKGSDEDLYTRAGNFRFDKEGYLVDPHGNVVQGWQVRDDAGASAAEEEEITQADSGVQIQGVPGDIRLENFQSSPEATDKIDKKVNLDSRSEDRTTAGMTQATADIFGGTDDGYEFEAMSDAVDSAGNTTLSAGTDYYVEDGGDNLLYENDGSTEVLVDPDGGGGDDYELYWDEDRFLLKEPGEDISDSGTFPYHGEPAADHDIEVNKYYEERNPVFAMFNQWDANEDTPLADNRYSYQTTINAYDSNGSSYEVTTYFDSINDEDVQASSGGEKHWEYMTTVNPVNDNRDHMEGSSKRGVLMTGSMSFNPAGDLTGQSAFTLNDDAALQDPDDLANWTTAEISQQGYPMFTANFQGEDNASFTSADDAHNMEMNFGLRNRTNNWTNNNTAADLSAEGVVGSYNTDEIPNFADPEREAMASTNYSTSSTTLTQNQDGYTAGFLQNISVDRDGVLTGRYDNGQVQELYALTLADFHNQQGLSKEGGNLFSETRSSGPPLTGLAGTSGLGEISANSLEQSNVDISEEFVSMITTQKGFQANSRTITTTDEMLQEVVNLKR